MKMLPPSRAAALRPLIRANCVVNPDTQCWEWFGVRDGEGYGRLYIGRIRPETPLAHRLSYMAFIGPIGDGLPLDHLCRVRHCVNPAHLEPVTHRVNVLRGMTIPAVFAARDACKHGHAYTPENVQMSGNTRRCRACHRERERRRRAHMSRKAVSA